MANMTQSQYDKLNDEKNQIKKSLQRTTVTPEEAIDALVTHCQFGLDRAVALADEWGKGIYLPYSEWSKIKVEA